MGGKSRKGGGVSRQLIERLKSGNIETNKGGCCGTKPPKYTEEDGFGLIVSEEPKKKKD